MKKSFIQKTMLILIGLVLILGCGKHDGTSEGFTQNSGGFEGLKAETIEGQIKTAMDTGDLALFLSILEHGAAVDLRLPETKNATPLIYSAVKNLPKFAHFLLTHKADPLLVDEDGKGAFQHAKEIGNRSRILMLLDPDRQRQGQLDLMLAIQKKKVPTIEELLHGGVNPNFVDEESGQTPLTRAMLVKKGTHVVKFILDWQDSELGISATNINFPNRDGLTPLEFAISKDNKEVIDLLKKLNAMEKL